MFFGKVVTQNTPYEFNESNVDEDAGEVLSITNVVLAPNSKVSPITILGKCIPLGQKQARRVPHRLTYQVKPSCHS